MKGESSRTLRWDDFPRSRSDFHAKTNPNVQARPSEQPDVPGASAEYPARANPDYGRAPLTDDQKELATQHLPLARSLARHLHARWHVERDEVESVAFVALVEAARAYVQLPGAQFSTFARYRIVGAILDFSRKATKSRHLQSSTMVSPWGVDMEVELYGKPVGINPELPVGADLDEVDTVESHFRPMSPLQARICRLIYMEGKTQEEVAETMECTASYVSKIHREAIDVLVKRFRDHGFQPVAYDSSTGATDPQGRDTWCRVEPLRARSRMPQPRSLATAC